MKTVTEKLDLKPEIDFKSICSPEEMLFFDIETTGIKKETTQLYLIGCACYEEGGWNIRQWLAQSGRDEEYLLEDFFDFASGYKMLVHFNGDGFDIPYLRYKADLYRLDADIDSFESFDIYRHARVLRKLLGLSSMSLRSIEEFLGLERDDRFNGGALIPVYYEYEKTGSPELEKLLLLHNYDDLQGMLKILPILSFCDLFQGKFTFADSQIFDHVLISDFRLMKVLPAEFDLWIGGEDGCEIQLCGEKDLLQLNVGIYEGCARLYLENVKDYYYLPAQDMVIHKDVAGFADKKNRVKATRKNCYVKKTGKFIPYFADWKGKIYYSDDGLDKKLIDLEDMEKIDRMSIFKAMARNYLDSIMSC